MITSFDKAIAALIGAVLSMAVMFGLDVPDFFKQPEAVTAVSGLVAGLLTWLVPNKVKPPEAPEDELGIGSYERFFRRTSYESLHKVNCCVVGGGVVPGGLVQPGRCPCGCGPAWFRRPARQRRDRQRWI